MRAEIAAILVVAEKAEISLSRPHLGPKIYFLRELH
jgi:hypothetical protein